jgi:ARG and Rhodanese-Phosphatase-superfamily-associated Protein domain
MKHPWTVSGLIFFFLAAVPLAGQLRRARPLPAPGATTGVIRQSWRVLDPVTRGNLSVYPVVSNLAVNASSFLTLDEGLSSGEVRIAEWGEVESPMLRSRDPWPQPLPPQRPYYGGARVNELVLVNESARPLLLLAGEVVSGGKQNRIIGSDLIVPPHSQPLPLTVFCVEHGRWSAGAAFQSVGAIAHPRIRQEAQIAKSQEGVWNSVARSAEVLDAPSPTSSYVDVLSSPQAQRAFDSVARSLESGYEAELNKRISGRGAVGVVVAINGRLVWADVFPSAELFRKYWPKLLRSYVLEAQGSPGGTKIVPSWKDALAFLLADRGEMSIREDPGVYRRTEIVAADYQIVALEALGKFADSSLLMHYNKMSRY